jgi:RNA polymerase sigma-70 factor (ECF subfamily)
LDALARRAASKSNLNDDELLGQVLAGDGRAFGEIVRHHEDRLYNTIYRLVGSAEDARDLLQDTFVKAYENLETFRGGSSLYTWLFRIAVNTSLSHRRRRKWVQMSAPPGDEDDPNPGNAVADTATVDPADGLVTAETEVLVQEAINGLDDEHRTVVVLRDIQHCDYRQIAEILEVPPGTVKSRLHRARMMLRDKLQPLLEH